MVASPRYLPQSWITRFEVTAMELLIPLKNAINSNPNPATCSSRKLATVPVQALPTTVIWTAPLNVA
jgi:hypothetical protein